MRKLEEVPHITEEAKLFEELSQSIVRPCDAYSELTKEVASPLLWIIISGRRQKNDQIQDKPIQCIGDPII